MCDRSDDATRDKLSHFYPVHSNRIGTIHKLSGHLIPEVLQVLRPGEERPDKVKALVTAELQARQKLRNLLDNGPTGDPVVNEHLTLMRHQELGREIAKVRDRFGFFLDTRTGKSPLSLTIIHDDIQEHPDHKWLVIAPLILLEQAWMEDANKFFPDMVVVNCHASTKKKRLDNMKKEANLYLTNTESFATYKEYFEEMGFHGCIVDESSSLKSATSKQSKAIVDFSTTMKRMYLLSGRPSPNGYYELYAQLKCIDYYCVAQSYTRFKEHFFVNVSRSPQFEVLELRPDRKDELFEILAKHAIYVDQADVLETAGRTFNIVPVTMPDELRKAYNDMKRKMAVDINASNKKITAASAGAMYNKLRQVVSGFVIDSEAVKENAFYEEDQQEVYLLSDYRFKALYTLLDSFGKDQAIIWCTYRYEFETIKQHLGAACAVVNGAVSLTDKNKALNDFKAGKVQFLVAHPGSAKFGLTLTNAHKAVYFSMTFSLEDFKQSSERIYGSIQKQAFHCDYYILLTENAIDAIIYNEVLAGKHEMNMALLNHLKGAGV